MGFVSRQSRAKVFPVCHSPCHLCVCALLTHASSCQPWRFPVLFMLFFIVLRIESRPSNMVGRYLLLSHIPSSHGLFQYDFVCLRLLMYICRFVFIERCLPLPADSFIHLAFGIHLRLLKLAFIAPACLPSPSFPTLIFKHILYMVRSTDLPTSLLPAWDSLSPCPLSEFRPCPLKQPFLSDFLS